MDLREACVVAHYHSARTSDELIEVENSIGELSTYIGQDARIAPILRTLVAEGWKLKEGSLDPNRQIDFYFFERPIED